MKAYEFSTSVTSDGRLAIPDAYTKDIPIGDSVRVIVLVDEQAAYGAEGTPPSHLTIRADETTGFIEGELDELPSLAEVMAEIKSSPQNPANIQPASGLLAEHLMNSPEVPDPLFDVTKWNREWDEVEAKMKAMEIADQKSEVDVELS